MPAYVVTTQRALIEMSNQMPRTEHELRKLPGVGKALMQRYAAPLLSLINEYAQEEEL